MSTITTNLQLIIEQLSVGNPAAIPTETVYGLAANAANPQAIKKIFQLKQRPMNHPLILHIAPEWDLSKWAKNIPSYVHALIQTFWPGPLTLVLDAKSNAINPLITGGQTTVAIRAPQHTLTLDLLRTLQTPLVAPSANPFGKISPTTAQHVQESFPDASLFILDGGRCNIGIESTILAATDPKYYQILRRGMIDNTQIQKTLTIEPDIIDETIRVPGQLDNHYQPQKPLYFFQDSNKMRDCLQQERRSAYVLAFSPIEGYTSYQLPNNPQQFAYELYFQLRKADKGQQDIIVIELPPNETQWQAVRERIRKAGSHYTR